MLKRALTLLILALPLFFAVQHAESKSRGYMFEVSTGEASFYSDKLHGRKTANGERYDKEALTAAHRSLPLGTIVRVTNLVNGRNAIVRINDRGPFKPSWIMDISKKAASQLNMLRRGVAPVQLEVLSDGRGVPAQSGMAFYLRVDKVNSPAEGEKRVRTLSEARAPSPPRKQLKNQKKNTPRQRIASAKVFSEAGPGGRKHYFVGQGPFTRYRDALKALQKVDDVLPDSAIVYLPVTPTEQFASR